MKRVFNDRATLKNNTKWGNRQDEGVGYTDRQIYRQHKKDLEKFSFRITDKFWWKSLTFEQQSCVSSDYYWIVSNVRLKNDEDIFSKLKSKYKNPIQKRELIIDFLLK